MPRLTARSLSLFEARLAHLTADSKPRWGRMDARTMVRHLRRALEISLGEIETPDRSIPGLRTVIRLLFFYVFTLWPPSRRRLPDDWLPPPEGSFAEERQLLLRTLGRFVRRLEEEPGRRAVHTLLGPLSLRSWSRVHGVHFDHHLRQFGLRRIAQSPPGS